MADETNVLTLKQSATAVVVYIAGHSGAIGKSIQLTVEGFTNATTSG